MANIDSTDSYNDTNIIQSRFDSKEEEEIKIKTHARFLCEKEREKYRIPETDRIRRKACRAKEFLLALTFSCF